MLLNGINSIINALGGGQKSGGNTQPAPVATPQPDPAENNGGVVFDISEEGLKAAEAAEASASTTPPSIPIPPVDAGELPPPASDPAPAETAEGDAAGHPDAGPPAAAAAPSGIPSGAGPVQGGSASGTAAAEKAQAVPPRAAGIAQFDETEEARARDHAVQQLAKERLLNLATQAYEENRKLFSLTGKEAPSGTPPANSAAAPASARTVMTA